MPLRHKKQIIFLVGPTASGKSEAAVLLARKINAEIISCDSMQIYRGMDILTSKPRDSLKKKIPHHLIGTVSLADDYNVARYRKSCLRKIKEIIKKGKTPLLVGGTGLYVSALVDGLFDLKSQSPSVRKKLYAQAKHSGNRCLYEKLQKVDAQAASKIHPHDLRRVVRALEVFRVTGEPISCLQKKRKGLNLDYDIRIFCLSMALPELYRRIEKRIDLMFKRGVIKEVEGLSKRRLGKNASCAIGIKEIKSYLENSYDLICAKELMKRNTRWYARRQLTWFRKDKRIRWIKAKAKDSSRIIAQRIWKELCSLP